MSAKGTQAWGLALLLAPLSLFWPNCAAAGADRDQLRTLAFNSAVARVFKENPDIKAERKRVAIRQEELRQAKARRGPTVSIDATPGTIDSSGTGENVNDSINRQTVGVVLNQSIYSGGGIQAGVRAAEFTLAAEKSKLQDTTQNTLVSFIDAVLSFLRDEKKAAIAEELERLESRQLEIVGARYERGEVSNLDVIKAKSSYVGSLENRAKAEAQFNQSRSDLESFGLSGVRVQGPGDIPNLPATLEDAVDVTDRQNPAILYKSALASAAEQRVDVARSKARPMIAGSLAAQKVWLSRKSDFRSGGELVAGVQLHAPLYSGGRIRSEIRGAHDEADEFQLQLEAERRTQERALRNAWSEWLSSKEIETIDSQKVDLLEKSVLGYQQRFVKGAELEIAVIGAKEQALNASDQVADVIYQSKISRFKILQQVGILAQVLELSDASGNSMH